MKNVISLATLAFLFNVAIAHAGGASGGGGNLNPDKKPEPAAVKTFIDENHKVAVPAILNWIGSWGDPGYDDARRIRARLFPAGKADIVDMSKSTKVTVVNGQPCIDPDTNERKDGAVLADGSVCIDAVRVADKTNEATYKIKSLALIAHELSHKMGPKPKDDKESLQREFEAKGIEGSIIAGSEGNIDAFRVGVRAKVLKDNLKNIRENFVNFMPLIEKNQMDDAFTCYFLGLMANQISGLDKHEGTSHLVGASPVSYKMQSTVTELRVRGNNLGSYCVGLIAGKNVRVETDSRFEGKNEIPVSELARKRHWAGVTTNRPVRNIEQFDKTDLLQEMIYVKVLVEKVERESGL